MISQKKYASDILKKFKINNSQLISTPVKENLKLTREIDDKRIDPTYYKSMIKSLGYLIVTRSYIVFGIRLLIRFMKESCMRHLKGAKIILRYILKVL